HTAVLLAVGSSRRWAAADLCEHVSLEKALTMAVLNEVIHQPARLRIMAGLAAISTDRQATFAFLKAACGLTDGKLGAHLRRLEEAGYVTITKTFVRQKPQTYVAITEAGRVAFEEHRAALQQILDRTRPLH